MVTSAILEVFSRLAVKQLVQDEPQLVAMCTVQLMTMGTSAILEVFFLALVQSNPQLVASGCDYGFLGNFEGYSPLLSTNLC